MNHSRATGELSRRIAVRMGLSPELTERIVESAVLHDIGKIRIRTRSCSSPPRSTRTSGRS